VLRSEHASRVEEGALLRAYATRTPMCLSNSQEDESMMMRLVKRRLTPMRLSNSQEAESMMMRLVTRRLTPMCLSNSQEDENMMMRLVKRRLTPMCLSILRLFSVELTRR
jgi:hypothetical protein